MSAPLWGPRRASARQFRGGMPPSSPDSHRGGRVYWQGRAGRGGSGAGAKALGSGRSCDSEGLPRLPVCGMVQPTGCAAERISLHSVLLLPAAVHRSSRCSLQTCHPNLLALLQAVGSSLAWNHGSSTCGEQGAGEATRSMAAALQPHALGVPGACCPECQPECQPDHVFPLPTPLPRSMWCLRWTSW